MQQTVFALDNQAAQSTGFPCHALPLGADSTLTHESSCSWERVRGLVDSRLVLSSSWRCRCTPARRCCTPADTRRCAPSAASSHPARRSLESQGLRGTLPASWSALSELRQVSLKYNRFTGTPLPPEWSALPKLTLFDAGGNLLDGSLPSDMGAFPMLSYLYLVGNLLPGVLPSSLGSLEYMSLEDNFLAGGLPEWTNSSVVSLKLSGNLLGGEVPEAWSSLSSLSFLELDDNQLTGELPPALRERLAGLRMLTLRGNYLGNASLAQLAEAERPQDADWSLLPQKVPEAPSPGSPPSRLFDDVPPAGPPEVVSEGMPQWALIAIILVAALGLMLCFALLGVCWFRRLHLAHRPARVPLGAQAKSSSPVTTSSIETPRSSPPAPAPVPHAETPSELLPAEKLTNIREAPDPEASLLAKPFDKAHEARYRRPPSAAGLPAPAPAADDSGSARLLPSPIYSELDDVDDGAKRHSANDFSSPMIPVRVSAAAGSTSSTSSALSVHRGSNTPLGSRRPSSGEEHAPLVAHDQQLSDSKPPPPPHRGELRLNSMLDADLDSPSRAPARPAFGSAEPSPTTGVITPSAAEAAPALVDSPAAMSSSASPSPWAIRGTIALASPSSRVASSSGFASRRSQSANFARTGALGGGLIATLGSLGEVAVGVDDMASPPKPASAPGEGRRGVSVSRSADPALAVITASQAAAAAYRAPAAPSPQRKPSSSAGSFVANLRRSRTRD